MSLPPTLPRRGEAMKMDNPSSDSIGHPSATVELSSGMVTAVLHGEASEWPPADRGPEMRPAATATVQEQPIRANTLLPFFIFMPLLPFWMNAPGYENRDRRRQYGRYNPRSPPQNSLVAAQKFSNERTEQSLTQPQAHPIYAFADFRLDAQRRVLSSRVDGRPLQCTGKVFDTLLYFVEHAGQPLDKQKLLDDLWPNVVVEDSNLTQTIHTLRRILGERPGEHRFIVTLPGRGYRFVAQVTTGEIDEPAQPAAVEPLPRPRFAGLRSLGVPLAAALFIVAGTTAFLMRAPAAPAASTPTHRPMLSVAVLPFVDMSEEKNQTYFADGLSEEILNLLAQSDSMRVIARTSSFSFKDRPEFDIATIARRLDATHVLEGSVRKSGDHVRITAQLVDGATSAHLWSHTYDRDLTDIFSVQDDIAAAVAAQLDATLGDGSDLRRADTTNQRAFEHYLHGRYFFNRSGESDVTRAREYFEQALHEDPDYARAWAGLAGTYNASFSSGQAATQEAQRAWLAAIERALSLGPGLAEVHVRAAQYYWWLGEWRRSEEHCKLAIALNSSDSHVLGVSALKAIAMGHRHEALSLQRRAAAVDPLSAQARAHLGVLLAAVGELDKAEVELRHARELSPTLPRIDFNIARVLVLQRRFDEALELAGQLPAGALREQGLALAHYGAGNLSAANAAFVRLTALADTPDANPFEKVAVAEVHAFRGDQTLALDTIENTLGPTANRQTNATSIWTRQVIHRSPFLASLHAHARWRPLFANFALDAGDQMAAVD
jgi:TolB-like protein/DNA-binding winged helix-turn-helix (wHTH) protein/tetratricopeptide (TPR) repeat protein